MDRKIDRIVAFVIVLSIIGIFGCAGKLFINNKAFAEVGGIFFADGACSDNLQLSMFTYNRALNIYNLT